MRPTARLAAFIVAVLLAGCAATPPFRTEAGGADVECNVVTARRTEACFRRSPEVSTDPAYTLHFAEFDDQGWSYPDAADPASGSGPAPGAGQAHAQIDRAIGDLARSLQAGEALSVLVYVHGWKHGAAHDDRDVQRFREMLADAALLEGNQRRVVGIYVGWRASTLTGPLANITFWTRKNVALHVSEGAVRELFARLRALRERANTPPAALANDAEARGRFLRHPPLRTIVIGHSFGGWVSFSALSPGLIEILAQPLDGAGSADAWRLARARQVADMILLVNPAFEATRYQPVHHLAQRLDMPRYEPPVLVMVTSDADRATRVAFPIGRLVNTLLQRPFTSDEQGQAAVRTPGFVDRYVTHRLTHDDAAQADCPNWRGPPTEGASSNDYIEPTETEDQRRARVRGNGRAEQARHRKWQQDLAAHGDRLADGWRWNYCGALAIRHAPDMGLEPAPRPAPMAPVWNVRTDASVVRDHSDIMGEPLHAFFRQLYLDLSR